MAHSIQLHSSRGSSLLFYQMQTTEHLGQLFQFHLQALSLDDALDVTSMLGEPMCVEVTDPVSGYKRFFHGIVSAAEQKSVMTIKDLLYAVYHFVLVPKLWLLSETKNCRIFKNKSVLQIVKEIFAEIGYTDSIAQLIDHYTIREFCVQYRESDLDFIHRLLEQEGMYYFFEHSKNAHRFVLCDGLGSHSAERQFAQLAYTIPIAQGKRRFGTLWGWESAVMQRAMSVQLTDYDPLKPKNVLDVHVTASKGHTSRVLESKENYDYPGSYTTLAVGEHYARIRAEARNAKNCLFYAATDVIGLKVGCLFTLAQHPVAKTNQEYLVVATSLQLSEVMYVSVDASHDSPPFVGQCTLIPSRHPYRSPQVTPKPTIAGVQTGRVHGKRVGDIQVDQYGRVEVDFFWNLPVKRNALSSCPVRVASCWAGHRFGGISIPRVGHEVVISFLEGDPDRPLIIGSVFNADAMPPYTLPANKTRSGFRTQSFPQGNLDTFNEICFEDKKGSEEVILHAQRDFKQVTKHDEYGETGHDRQHRVARNDSLNVGERLLLRAGKEITLSVGSASLTLDATGKIALRGMQVDVVGSTLLSFQSSYIKMQPGIFSLISAGPATFTSQGVITITSVGPLNITGLPAHLGVPGIVT